MTLTDFLLARIAEDERWQGGTNRCAYDDGGDDGMHYDRTRVLAECQAKRRIVAEVSPLAAKFGDGGSSPLNVLTLLALPYSNHPDFDSAWANA